ADARIISRAVVSNVPYFPKKMPIVLIVAFATLCLSTAIVVISALLRADTYRPALAPAVAAPAPKRSLFARTRSTDRLPAAANVPAPQPAAPAPVAAAQAMSTSIDAIATQVMHAGEGSRRIAVIGSARNVGTTLTSIALSRMLARSARVVLIDLSFVS